MNTYSIGIDIGGTKIAVGLVDRHGDILYKQTTPTPSESRASILNTIKAIVLSYMKMSEKEGFKINGIGIGSAGQIDPNKGVIISGTKNIKDWNQVPIRDVLQKATNLPVWVDNDANTFALAEHRLGKGKDLNHIVCLTLGTGVGGGVVSDGSLIHGTFGGAGELGHMTVNMNGPACNCGSNGCLETYASGTGIAQRMRDQLANMPTDDLPAHIADYKQHLDALTSKEVFQWREEGYEPAVAVIDTAVQALIYGIVSLIHTFNPQAIVLGGGLVAHWPNLAATISKQIKDIGMASLVKPVKIFTSELGRDSGLIGAAMQVWHDVE
ncbi:ROK family protein [Lentibacillus saliphilus]|uniref:ROK family protein n=1 Tax=Lentibacillus saliphilus TaxID=2737028 RepID=UPI001C2F3150